MMNDLTLNQQTTNNQAIEMSPEAQMQLIPAFLDMQNGEVYISRFIDGSMAPMHVYDSLPDSVLTRNELNVISGFLYNGQFVTGDQAYHHLSDIRA